MYQIRETTQEVKRAAKRRIRILIIAPIFLVMLSVAALFIIEPKYRSSTTILVEQEDTLNPLILYDMAVSLADEDRLRSFNEIIYSRSTIEKLIERLELDDRPYTQRGRYELVESVRDDIGTRENSSDSFEITFYNTDPEKARQGAEFLAEYFVQRRLQSEKRRHEEAVSFFESKVEELEQIVSMSRDEMLSQTQQRVQEVPKEPGAIRTELREVESRINEIEWDTYQKEEQLEVISTFLEKSDDTYDFQPLFNLPLDEIPFGSELGRHLEEYDELIRQYTTSYPGVREVMEQIVDVAERIPSAMEREIAKDNQQIEELTARRNSLLNDLESTYIASRQEESMRSDQGVYVSLYNEMTSKLEQAKINRELSERSSENFVVLDEAITPDTPVSPNKQLIVGLGLFSGLLLGVMLAAIAEALDTTVRSGEVIRYQKPIIAYISYE